MQLEWLSRIDDLGMIGMVERRRFDFFLAPPGPAVQTWQDSIPGG